MGKTFTNGLWAIAFHGGAGNMARDMDRALRESYDRSMRHILDAGTGILSSGGTALDAVEAAVVALEDDPLYNAGKGAYFTLSGAHELDASIMEGATRRCGAVAGVRKLKNPVKAARLVMERTPHVLLGGARADAFAIDAGCERVEQAYFFTDRAWRVLQNARLKAGQEPLAQPADANGAEAMNEIGPSGDSSTGENVGGTVGCVALDRYGNLAAATSTGGSNGKWAGRIGDTPVIGAGNVATNACAVSCTGQGEEFIRHSIAARVAWLVEYLPMPIDEAVNHCLAEILPSGAGGMIAIDARGNISTQASTAAMPRGVANSAGRYEVAIWMKERKS